MAGPRRQSKADEAAKLLAEGDLTFEEIAERVGVTRQTFYNWRRDPKFQAEVKEIREQLADDTFRRGAALRFRRVRVYSDLWNRLLQVVEERAQDPKLRKVAGGKTGTVTMTFKGVGVGQAAKVIPVFEVDTGLINQIQSLGKQIAQEMGQWSDKTEVSGPDGGPIQAEVGGRITLVEVHKVTRDDDGAEPAAGQPV